MSSATTRYYLSESEDAARKVFFDFATLPERATSADSTDSTGCTTRFNGYDEFVGAGPAENASVVFRDRSTTFHLPTR
jgi:hypothetical protein